MPSLLRSSGSEYPPDCKSASRRTIQLGTALATHATAQRLGHISRGGPTTVTTVKDARDHHVTHPRACAPRQQAQAFEVCPWCPCDQVHLRIYRSPSTTRASRPSPSAATKPARVGASPYRKQQPSSSKSSARTDQERRQFSIAPMGKHGTRMLESTLSATPSPLWPFQLAQRYTPCATAPSPTSRRPAWTLRR